MTTSKLRQIFSPIQGRINRTTFIIGTVVWFGLMRTLHEVLNPIFPVEGNIGELRFTVSIIALHSVAQFPILLLLAKRFADIGISRRWAFTPIVTLCIIVASLQVLVYLTLTIPPETLNEIRPSWTLEYVGWLIWMAITITGLSLGWLSIAAIYLASLVGAIWPGESKDFDQGLQPA